MSRNGADGSFGTIRDLPLIVRILVLLGYFAAGAILLWLLSGFLFGGVSGIEQITVSMADMIQTEDIVIDDNAMPDESAMVSENTMPDDSAAGNDSAVVNQNAVVDEPPVSDEIPAAESDAPGKDAVTNTVPVQNLPSKIYENWTCDDSRESLVLTALDEYGTPLWSFTEECSSRVEANDVVYRSLEWMENGNIVYINNAAAEVITAIDRTTGRTIWNVSGCYGCPTVYAFGSDGTLYIGSNNEFYGPACAAVSADGRELWRITGYYTAQNITAYDSYVHIEFNDWGYAYSVDFDLNGNKIN